MAILQRQKWFRKKIKAAMEFMRHAREEDVDYQEQEEEAKQNAAKLVSYYHQGESTKGGYLPVKGQALYYVVGPDKKGRIELLHPVYLDNVKISKRSFEKGIMNIWVPAELSTERYGVKCDPIKVADGMLAKAKFLAGVGRDFKQYLVREAVAQLKGIRLEDVPKFEVKKTKKPKMKEEKMAKHTKVDKKLRNSASSSSSSASKSASSSSSSASASASDSDEPKKKTSKTKKGGDKVSKKGHSKHGSKKEKETKSKKTSKSDKKEKKSKKSKKSSKKGGATRTRLAIPDNGGASQGIYEYLKKHKKATIEQLQGAATKAKGSEREVTETAVKNRLDRIAKIFEKHHEKTLKVKGDKVEVRSM